jgi:hypothetical protein
VRMATKLLALAGLVASPAVAIEVISFDEIPAQNDNFATLTEEYAHLGVHFSSTDDGAVWNGMSQGDPGGWELEGSNGPAFAGFNGDSYLLTASFDAPVPAFQLDVSAASGAEPGGPFTLEGYRAGALVDRQSVSLGGLNEWMTVALAGDVDQVRIVGDTSGFSPFGVDNLRWGIDAPTRIDARIDVLPGNAENPLNPGSCGVVPVALLGSDTLDVMDVEPTSLALGVKGAPAEQLAYSDVNGDGWFDLVAHYPVPETGTAYGDTSICLTGATADGVELAGCDAIRTVPRLADEKQRKSHGNHAATVRHDEPKGHHGHGGGRH